MENKLAVFVGISDKDNVITGGERQLQEMINGLKRNGFEVRFLEVDNAIQNLGRITQGYKKQNVYIINDYSKRFSLWKFNWICKIKYGYQVCCSVGAFYFDYRTSKIKNFIDYIISYVYLKPAAQIFTTGEAVNKKLRKMGCKRKIINAVYPAIRESLLEEADNFDLANEVNREKIVLIVGRFHPVKGYDYLLDAITLCKERTDLHFVLVGDYERKPDDYYKKIKSRIYDEGLESNITIYGKTKNDAELATLYRRAWCYLHTSVWESSPITVCEPLLFGKPVIATNVGGTAEYLTDGVDSILVEAKNGKAIVSAIDDLINNPGRYKKLEENAYISSKKYRNRTWKTVGDEYAVILK